MSAPRAPTPDSGAPINWSRVGKLAQAAHKASGDTVRDWRTRAGLSHRNWIELSAGRKIPALPFLRLCDHLGLDPVTLDPAPATMPPFRGEIHWQFLGLTLHARMALYGHTVRDAAPRAGVSTATIERCCHARIMAADSLLRVAAYTSQHPHEVSILATGSGADSPNAEVNENNALQCTSPVKHASVKHASVKHPSVKHPRGKHASVKPGSQS